MHSNQKGFTLIEILIAITLLSFMMVSIYTIISNSTDTKDRIVSEDREFVQIEVFFQRLESDFSKIYSPLYFQSIQLNDPQLSYTIGKVYTQKPYLETDNFPLRTARELIVPTTISDEKSELIFLSSDNKRILAESKQSDYFWVKYGTRPMKIDEDETQEFQDASKGLLEITRSTIKENIYQEENDWEKTNAFTVLSRVKSIEYKFWSSKKKKMVESLRDVGSEKNNIRLIQVDLKWVDITGAEVEFSRTFRTYWPFFNTLEDERARLKALKPLPAKTTNNNSGTPTISPPNEPN